MYENQTHANHAYDNTVRYIASMRECERAYVLKAQNIVYFDDCLIPYSQLKTNPQSFG